MKKKGFTLIELIGVIVILSIIIVVGFPKIMGGLEGVENDISDANEKLIFSKTEEYLNKYVDDKDPDGKNYPRTINASYCISTTTLNNQGYLSDSFAEKVFGKNENNEINVYYVIAKINSKRTIEYTLLEECPQNN